MISKFVLFDIFQLVLGIFILFTVLFQDYYLGKTTANYCSLNYYSYFTIWSNLAVSVFLIVSSFNLFNTKLLDFLRGGATLYILVTGMVFIILLKGQNDLFLSWVNIVLHYAVPLIMVAYLFFKPIQHVSFSQSLVWLSLLVLYLIYTLIRGSRTSWYPYDFINLSTQGIKGVLLNSTLITFFILLIDWLVLLINRR